MSGSAGAAGEPSFCSLPPETGECRGYMGRYAFDRVTGLCLPFVYGGCGGNANNFETAQSCYATCGGSAPLDPARCESPLECTLMHSLCCGACEPSTLMNRVAVRTDQVAAVNEAMSCDCEPCGDADVNPWLGAACSENHCVSFDARTTKLVTCEQDDDCVLRAGIGCCVNCAAGRGDFVALNREADLRPFSCGDEPVACDDCVAVPPFDLVAVCSSGRCAVAYLAID